MLRYITTTTTTTTTITPAFLSQSSSFILSFIQSYSSIIPPKPDPYQQQLTTLLSQPNWQKNPSLTKLIPKITPSLFSNFISQSPPSLHPQTALNLFNHLSLSPSFRPDPQTYAALLKFFIKTRSLTNANTARTLMIKSCNSPDDMSFVLIVLRTLNRGGCEVKFHLSLRGYNMLLQSLARLLMVDEMKRVYREMLHDNVSPNIYSFNAMINAFCKLGNVCI